MTILSFLSKANEEFKSLPATVAQGIVRHYALEELKLTGQQLQVYILVLSSQRMKNEFDDSHRSFLLWYYLNYHLPINNVEATYSFHAVKVPNIHHLEMVAKKLDGTLVEKDKEFSDEQEIIRWWIYALDNTGHAHPVVETEDYLKCLILLQSYQQLITAWTIRLCFVLGAKGVENLLTNHKVEYVVLHPPTPDNDKKKKLPSTVQTTANAAIGQFADGFKLKTQLHAHFKKILHSLHF